MRQGTQPGKGVPAKRHPAGKRLVPIRTARHVSADRPALVPPAAARHSDKHRRKRRLEGFHPSKPPRLTARVRGSGFGTPLCGGRRKPHADHPRTNLTPDLGKERVDGSLRSHRPSSHSGFPLGRRVNSAAGERGGLDPLRGPRRPVVTARFIDPPTLPLPLPRRAWWRSANVNYSLRFTQAAATWASGRIRPCPRASPARSS